VKNPDYELLAYILDDWPTKAEWAEYAEMLVRERRVVVVGSGEDAVVLINPTPFVIYRPVKSGGPA
jgi:hypothetical protein